MKVAMNTRRKLFVALAVSVAGIAALAPGAGQGGTALYDPGDIIVADSVHNAIKAVDPVTGTATPVASGNNFSFPADVTFASDGDVLVVDRDAFGSEPDGGIIRVDRVTGEQTVVSNNSISRQAGGQKLFGNPIALDRKGGAVYVVDFHRPHKVIKVDISSGKATLVTSGHDLDDPSDIVAAGVKKPLVTASDSEGNAEILAVNPKTGQQSFVSRNGKFKYPQGIVVTGSGDALVTDAGRAAIFKVNTQNGNQKTVSHDGSLASPIGIALLDNHTAAVSDLTSALFSGAIYRVDLDTGEQTLINGTAFNNPLGIDVAP